MCGENGHCERMNELLTWGTMVLGHALHNTPILPLHPF